MFGISIKDAADIYYESETAQLIEEKVADLHCRSEKYLATKEAMAGRDGVNFMGSYLQYRTILSIIVLYFRVGRQVKCLRLSLLRRL